MTLIVNLFAGPGAGKSTTAAGLFHKMKMDGRSCELVTEFAKDMVWAERHKELSVQPYIFGKQLSRLERLLDKVDVIITDSPLLLSSIYCGTKYPASFRMSVKDIFLGMNNLNFFLNRLKTYVPTGRSQTELEAKDLDRRISTFLTLLKVPFERVDGDRKAVDFISERVYNKLEK